MTNHQLDSEENCGRDDYVLLQHHWQQRGLSQTEIDAFHAEFERLCLDIFERRLPPLVRGTLEHYWAGVDVRTNTSAVFALITNIPVQWHDRAVEYASSVVSTTKPFLRFEEKEALICPHEVAEMCIAMSLAKAYLIATCQHPNALRETLVPQPSAPGVLPAAPEGNAHELRAYELVRRWGFDPLTLVAWREALVYAYKEHPEKKLRPELCYPTILKYARQRWERQNNLLK